MALHFQLLDKTTNEAVSLSKVDDLICENVYNCKPHPVSYGAHIFNWFDSIGFQLATGKTFEQVREHFSKEDSVWTEELPIINKTIDYLQANYNTRSWC